MHRRLQEKEPLDEVGFGSLPTPSQDEETELRETYSCNFRLSTNPQEQCRFILLGGDELAKNDACRFILRTAQTQQVQRSNLGSCEMKENYVHGRHVCVVNSPFLWMDRLATKMYFSKRVKAIQNEMQNCVSLVFPGPHAFLLVIRVGTGKEHYLLKAIASVFGKEAIDYSMVLFIAGSETNSGPSQNAKLKSLLMCKDRYHLLENTDESVTELFRKVEEMISNNKSKFFIPSAYEKFTEVNFESWEKERIDLLEKYKDKEDKLCRELKDQREMFENASQLKEDKIRQLQDASQQRECEAMMELNASQQREGELKMKLNAFHERENELMMKLEASEKRERELVMKLNASQKSESKLRLEFETSQQREREQMLQLQTSQQRERELRKELNAFQCRETELRREDRRREVESEPQEPQATGAELVRWGSKQQIYPTFSSDQAEYLERV